MKKLLILALILTGCNKENQEELKDVTFTVYTEQSKATLRYIDKDENWIEVPITSNNYTLTIKQTEDNFNYQTQLRSIGADSLHITGTVEGKVVQDGYRSSGGNIHLSIQISNAR